MRLGLITYADAGFKPQADMLVESALTAGFDHGSVHGPELLRQTAFYAQHEDIFNARKGAGFWLWKPYIILQEVLRLKSDECLLYSDAGRSPYYAFTSRPERMLRFMLESGKGFLLGCPVPHLGRIGSWTKRDCLELMDATDAAVVDAPLIMTWGLWSKTPEAIAFLEAWLAFASDARCLTDRPNLLGKPNLRGFVEHRFDQSIMSILAFKMSAPRMDFTDRAVQRLLELRPGSEIAHTFYKRPQNAEDLLSKPSAAILIREYWRLRRFRRWASGPQPQSTASADD